MHFPAKFLQKPSPRATFSTVHLPHRLYGVDAPVRRCADTPSGDYVAPD